jgi:hypothetical protein
MRLAQEEQDLVRWLYVVAGYPRARLARDFECSIGDIEAIIRNGLGQILNPARAAGGKQKPRKLEFQVGSVPSQTETPKLEQRFESFRRALIDC